MGVVPALALAGVPMLVATLLAFHDGGYFVTSWGVASIVLWGVVVAGLVLMRTGIGGRPGLVAVSALPALAAWQGISSLWADEPSAAVAAMNLTLLYAAALAIGVVATGPGVRLAHVVVMGLAVTVIVAAAGVGARLFPDAIGGDELSRLNTPISYWNALGAVLAFGIVAAVGIGAADALPVWARSLCVAATPLLSLGLYFTLSRGAILIVVVVLLALAAFTPRRVECALIAAVAACASAVPVVLAARRELTSLGSEPLTTASEPRHQVALALVAATLICGAGAYTVNVALGGLTARPRRALASGLAVAAATAVVVGYVAYAPEEGPVTWADRQVESFQSYGSGERNDTSVASQLATAAGSGRWQNWSVAVDQFRSAPVLGTGAGDYRFWWNRERPISLYVVNAHSLYLEVLGESGVVGLVLLCEIGRAHV